MEETELRVNTVLSDLKHKTIRNAKEYYSAINRWIRTNNEEFFVLLFIIFLGALLRLYKIDQYMTFLGDEGRDVIVVRRFLVEHHIMLIGPGTSIGDMYLGPLYYYLMAPALLLAGFSPVGPAVQIAILGTVTVFMVWYISREWFGRWAAFFSSFLYAISPVVIIYSRSSWNPNIMPFFALLCIYSIWKVYKYADWKWLTILGVSFAFVLQSHYLGLLLFPTLLIFWLLTFWKLKSHIPYPKFLYKEFILNSLIGFVTFLALMSPLVFFDARHGWHNFGAMKKFFTERQATVSANPLNGIPSILPAFEKSASHIIAAGDQTYGLIVSAVLIAGTLFYLYYLVSQNKKRYLGIFDHPISLVILWISFAFFGLSLYKQEIYDHYYGFIFPAPFMLLGAVGQEIATKARHNSGKYFKLAGASFAVFYFLLAAINLLNNPFKYPPNRQLQRTQEVDRNIQVLSGGKLFNFAVIADRNYEGAYKYFLQLWGTHIVDIDPQNTKDTIADQLFVVCEKPKEKCDPTHNAKAEVANFGWSKIESVWEISGVTLYKLIHTK